MISPGHSTKVFVCRKPVDFRYGYDRLSHICKSIGKLDPYCGHAFIFFNKAYTRVKIVFFDGTGSCMFWKRLEKGKFHPPKLSGDRSFATIESSQFALLLEGAAPIKVAKPVPWQPPSSALQN